MYLYAIHWDGGACEAKKRILLKSVRYDLMDIPSLTTIDVDSYLNICYTIDIPKTASKFQHLLLPQAVTRPTWGSIAPLPRTSALDHNHFTLFWMSCAKVKHLLVSLIHMLFFMNGTPIAGWFTMLTVPTNGELGVPWQNGNPHLKDIYPLVMTNSSLLNIPHV